MNEVLAPFKKKEADKLTQLQQDAMEMVLLGWQNEDIAEKLGVSRHTIMRWMNKNADFIAELRYRREQLWAEHRLQLFNLIHRALNVVESQLLDGDKNLRMKAALGLLKMPAVQNYLAAKKFEGEQQDFLLMALERTLIQRGTEPEVKPLAQSEENKEDE